MQEDKRIRVNKEAYAQIADAYHERTKNLDMKWQVAMFADMLPKGGSLLDFMSGPARDALVFTNLGYQVTCMDYEQKFLDMVKRDVPSAKVVQGDARTVSIDEQFDGVWCNAGIFMLPRKDAPLVLENIARHLKKDGALYINAKLCEPYQVPERTYQDAKYGVPRFESLFPREEFKQLLEPHFDIRREMIAYAQNIAYRTHPFLDVFAVKK